MLLKREAALEAMLSHQQDDMYCITALRKALLTGCFSSHLEIRPCHAFAQRRISAAGSRDPSLREGVTARTLLQSVRGKLISKCLVLLRLLNGFSCASTRR